MIAITREHPRQDHTKQADPRQRAREETYAIRRALVRRLQAATQGVYWRDRLARQRQFSREWREVAGSKRLDLLRRALALGPAVAAEAGPNWRSSFLLSLAVGTEAGAASVVARRRVARTPEPETAGTTGPLSSEGLRGIGRRALSALDLKTAEIGRESLQADLFPPELNPGPL